MSNTHPGLPPLEYSFDIEVIGNKTKNRYNGNFTFKKPNLGMKAEIAKTSARLGADVAMSLDVNTQTLHYTMAWLQHTLVNFPKWWEESNFGHELYDENVLTALLKKTMEFERQWGNDLKAEATKK